MAIWIKKYLQPFLAIHIYLFQGNKFSAIVLSSSVLFVAFFFYPRTRSLRPIASRRNWRSTGFALRKTHLRRIARRPFHYYAGAMATLGRTRRRTAVTRNYSLPNRVYSITRDYMSRNVILMPRIHILIVLLYFCTLCTCVYITENVLCTMIRPHE